MILSKSKKPFLALGSFVITALLLVACGDSATNTPTAATTVAATKAAAPTTAAATTVAATTAAATTAAATTGSATTSAAGGSGSSLPGLTEVQISDTAKTAVSTAFKATGAQVKFFAADTDVATVATGLDGALVGEGYAFAIPSMTKPISTGGSTVGVYSKSGSQDFLFIAVPIPADPTQGGGAIPGVDPTEMQQILTQLKGHQTLVIALSGDNLVQALANLGASSSSTTPGATTAAASMTTAATTTTDASMTTAAATTAAASMTTAAASGSSTGSLDFLSSSLPTGVTELNLSATAKTSLTQKMGIPGADVKFFTADVDGATIGTALDGFLTAQGYAFSIPGTTKPISTSGNTVGLYSKSGAVDVLFVAAAIPADPTTSSMSLPGVDPAEVQQLATQLKGHQTLLVAIGGNNLLQALMALSANAGGSTGGSTTPVTTP